MKALDFLSRKKQNIYTNNSTWNIKGFPNPRLRTLMKGCMRRWTARALIACTALQHVLHRPWEASKGSHDRSSRVVTVSHPKWNPRNLAVFNRLKERLRGGAVPELLVGQHRVLPDAPWGCRGSGRRSQMPLRGCTGSCCHSPVFRLQKLLEQDRY